MVEPLTTYIIKYIAKDCEVNLVQINEEEYSVIETHVPIIFDTFLSDVFSKYAILRDNISYEILHDLIQSDCTLLACLLYRIERSIFLVRPQSRLLYILANFMRRCTSIELYFSTGIGPGLNIQHGSGIVVGPRYTIGKNFIIHQGVTLGQRKSPDEIIEIGDNVIIYAGAKILGKIKIGDNVKIAANAVLLTDADENSTYAGIPAKKLLDPQ